MTPTTVPSTDRVGPARIGTPDRLPATWSSCRAFLPLGFFDPKMPAGEPTEPEPGPQADAKPDAKPEVKPDAKPGAPPEVKPVTWPPPATRGSGTPPTPTSRSAGAFFVGNFNGFNVYDLNDPKRSSSPDVCPGGQVTSGTVATCW